MIKKGASLLKWGCRACLIACAGLEGLGFTCIGTIHRFFVVSK